MEYNKQFFEKVFSTKRMERYFNLYPGDEARAVLHYRCNLELAEAFYTSLSVFEVTLRNAGGFPRPGERLAGTLPVADVRERRHPVAVSGSGV